MSNKNTNIYLDAKTSFLEPVVNQYGGHMVMTNVKKGTRTKYINIDTRFNDDYDNNKISFNKTSSFNFTFPERLRDVKSIRVVSAEVPISFYNFSSSLGNNSFKLTDTSTSTSKMMAIKDGYYNNPTSLKTEIVSKITQLSLTNSNFGQIVTDISNDNFYTFNSTSGNFNIAFDTDPSGNFDKHKIRSKLGWALGFRNQSYNISHTVGNGGGIISESMANLNTIRYLYLVVDEFSSGFTNSFICPLQNYLLNKRILARIAVDMAIFPFGSVQVSNTYNGFLFSDVRQYNGAIDIQRLNIQLVNEYGDAVNFNGEDFSFLLELICE